MDGATSALQKAVDPAGVAHLAGELQKGRAGEAFTSGKYVSTRKATPAGQFVSSIASVYRTTQRARAAARAPQSAGVPGNSEAGLTTLPLMHAVSIGTAV